MKIFFKKKKKNLSDELFLHFSSKVQILTVFSIIHMIRIRFFNCHTFVPISWMCKKQTAVSHSSTESEIISLATGLCKALEEMHVNLEDLHCEQYRARDELPLIQLWARGRADDCVTLPADLETMDLLTTATSRPTLSAAELRLRNDFEDLFGTKRSQSIRSAEFTLPILMSWDFLVVDKPADARSRSDKSTEQILTETTCPCPRCFVFIRRAGCMLLPLSP